MKQANQKLKEYKARDREALLAEAASNLSRSIRRSNLDASIASSQKGKQLQSNNDASDAEPVVPEKPAAKEPVLSTKKRRAAPKEASRKSSTEPVVTCSRKSKTPQGDSRKDLID